MKVGSRLNLFEDEEYHFIAQLGVHHLALHGREELMTEPGERGVVRADELRKLQEGLRPYQLELYVFVLPQRHNTQYWHARIGDPSLRDREIEDVCETVRICGDLGIPVVEWTWYITRVCGRAYPQYETGRGGALVSFFDYDLVRDERPEGTIEMSAEQMWANIIYFMERVMPVAEQAGVRMAVHPNDPPTKELGGEGRVLSSFDDMKRLVAEVDSPANGFNICQGTVAEMTDTDVLAVIRHFGERDRINHCHFRNVTGSVPRFQESFIDDGDVDMYEAMKVYHEIGYQHMMMPDHVPTMAGDESRRAARAYATGYIRAVMHVVGEL